MTFRNLMARHAAFIEGHLENVDDGVAFGFGQAATLVLVTASIAATGVVAEETISVAVNVDGPLEESDQYQGAEFATSQSKSVLFYVPEKGLRHVPKKGDRIVLGDGTTYVATIVDRLQVRGSAHVYRMRCGQVVVSG